MQVRLLLVRCAEKRKSGNNQVLATITSSRKLISALEDFEIPRIIIMIPSRNKGSWSDLKSRKSRNNQVLAAIRVFSPKNDFCTSVTNQVFPIPKDFIYSQPNQAESLLLNSFQFPCQKSSLYNLLNPHSLLSCTVQITSLNLWNINDTEDKYQVFFSSSFNLWIQTF